VVCIEEVQFLYLLGAEEDLALGLLDGGGVCLHVGLLDAKGWRGQRTGWPGGG
jgi:hypothetical protein